MTIRRTIYLTIMSSLDMEECTHKLLEIKLGTGQVTPHLPSLMRISPLSLIIIIIISRLKPSQIVPRRNSKSLTLSISLAVGFQEIELCTMLLECCSQERTYSKFYGHIGTRLCLLDRKYQELFEDCFSKQVPIPSIHFRVKIGHGNQTMW